MIASIHNPCEPRTKDKKEKHSRTYLRCVLNRVRGTAHKSRKAKRNTQENNVTAFDPFRAHPPNTQSCRCSTRPSIIHRSIRPTDQPTVMLVSSSWRRIAAPNLKKKDYTTPQPATSHHQRNFLSKPSKILY